MIQSYRREASFSSSRISLKKFTFHISRIFFFIYITVTLGSWRVAASVCHRTTTILKWNFFYIIFFWLPCFAITLSYYPSPSYPPSLSIPLSVFFYFYIILAYLSLFLYPSISLFLYLCMGSRKKSPLYILTGS